MRMQSDNVNWFVGVVENRNDPLQQGRVQVRVVGVHPFSRIQGDVVGISVEDLPWMSILLPSNSASVSGISGAITGILDGSSVFGLWLDKYKTNGFVLGTYSGNQVNIPNSEEGFSDPSGQYPNSAGPDTNGLNAGGASGDNSGANAQQDANTSTGVSLGSAKDVPGEDNNPSLSLENMLKADEGLNNTIHWVDELPHVGIGHLIMYKRTRDMPYIRSVLGKQIGRTMTGNQITQEECTRLFNADVAKVRSEIKKSATIAPVYMKLNKSRQMALENMCFQMGTGGLANFKQSLALIGASKWAEAAAGLKQSLWAKQTPGRANKIAMIIKNGNLGSYGVLPPKPAGKRMFRSNTSIVNDWFNGFNPLDPLDTEIEPNYDLPLLDKDPDVDLSKPVIDDLPPGILFIEPKSSYRGDYPYVKATQTEGGHIQEFDDTPGQERYRRMHPSGSYTEDAADGRKTDKAVGDRYFLTEGTLNMLASDYNINILGNETFMNMSNVNRNIAGNNSIFVQGNNDINVQGNETKNITGDGTIKVSGNIKIIVEGNADIQVQGNATSKVSGNYDLNVNGSFTAQSATGMKFSAPKIDFDGTFAVDSSGPMKLSAPRIDMG